MRPFPPHPAPPSPGLPRVPRFRERSLSRQWRRLLAGLWLLAGLAGYARAADPVVAFELASRLYEEGKYREAAEAYAALAAQGRVSANLCFNEGNAWFKAGQLGRAIVSYRLAARLAPRDPDIEANLRMARELISGGPPPRPAWWQRLTRPLTLDEWAGLAAVCLWTCSALLILRQLRPDRERGRRRGTGLVLCALVFVGLGLLGAWLDRRGATEVVVTVPEAVVRYGPLEVSPQLQVIQDGVELRVLDRKDGWLQVGGLPRGLGWLPATNVTAVPR
jgi:tetratricopeptide (TPR) repeat protein